MQVGCAREMQRGCVCAARVSRGKHSKSSSRSSKSILSARAAERRLLRSRRVSDGGSERADRVHTFPPLSTLQLSFIYNLHRVFHGSLRTALTQKVLLSPKLFFRLFLHWMPECRRYFMHILVYKAFRTPRTLLPSKTDEQLLSAVKDGAGAALEALLFGSPKHLEKQTISLCVAVAVVVGRVKRCAHAHFSPPHTYTHPHTHATATTVCSGASWCASRRSARGASRRSTRAWKTRRRPAISSSCRA